NAPCVTVRSEWQDAMTGRDSTQEHDPGRIDRDTLGAGDLSGLPFFVPFFRPHPPGWLTMSAQDEDGSHP
ncbi:hypothetical protein ACYTTR_13625, partial [Cobetia marina]